MILVTKTSDQTRQRICMYVVVVVVIVAVVFFTLTDRASTIPTNNIHGCQSGTWSAGQEKITGTSTMLQREHGNKAKTKNKTRMTKRKEQQHKAHARKKQKEGTR